jgi:uncharacterized membrane-anchored protein YhcB (DUF1043 family)
MKLQDAPDGSTWYLCHLSYMIEVKVGVLFGTRYVQTRYTDGHSYQESLDDYTWNMDEHYATPAEAKAAQLDDLRKHYDEAVAGVRAIKEDF